MHALPLIDYRDLRAAEMLRERGVRDFVIQAGGDLYVAGPRGDRPWRLGIRDPRGPADRSFAALDFSDSTLNMSSSARALMASPPDRSEPTTGLATGLPRS